MPTAMIISLDRQTRLTTYLGVDIGVIQTIAEELRYQSHSLLKTLPPTRERTHDPWQTDVPDPNDEGDDYSELVSVAEEIAECLEERARELENFIDELHQLTR